METSEEWQVSREFWVIEEPLKYLFLLGRCGSLKKVLTSKKFFYWRLRTDNNNCDFDSKRILSCCLCISHLGVSPHNTGLFLFLPDSRFGGHGRSGPKGTEYLYDRFVNRPGRPQAMSFLTAEVRFDTGTWVIVSRDKVTRLLEFMVYGRRL